MEFAPPTFDIAKLQQKIDMRGLTVLVGAVNVFRQGRFYMLWKNGNFIIIQAEPWWRPGISGFLQNDEVLRNIFYLEEHRALWHLQEVVQTMVDTIVVDGDNNWAHLVRMKDNSYRLVYKNRRLVQNCDIWTKVVELDDIELTRFVSGLSWEGKYEGKDVDISIGWLDDLGKYISGESRGQKLVQSRGVGHYFFDLVAHVSKNGAIVGLMTEALIGRPVTQADRSVVFEAFADLQRHGILLIFDRCDIYITERGVRFANACNARYYSDHDELAREAEDMWQKLRDIFNGHMAGWLSGSRSIASTSSIIPRLPSPGRQTLMTPEEAIIRWFWSITTSDDYCRLTYRAFAKFYSLFRPVEKVATRRDRRIKGDNRPLLPPDDSSDKSQLLTPRTEPADEPLVVNRVQSVRYHAYARPTSRRLLLPQES